MVAAGPHRSERVVASHDDDRRAGASANRRLRAIPTSAAWTLLCAWCLVLADVTLAPAADVTDVLRSKAFAGLELAPLAPALAGTVASTYPVASASTSVTFEFDPSVGSFVRQASVPGPLIGERAETLGQGQLDFALTYSYVNLSTINGQNLHSLVNRTTVDGQIISFPVEGGVTLKDGRFTNFLPVRVIADLDVRAHILTPELTYGITPDLDVNLTLPLVRASLGLTARTTAPDPRLPSYALADPSQGIQNTASESDTAFGLGDVLLRAKYAFWHGAPCDAAAMLGLSVPTGSEQDLHGVGHTRVQPTLVLSRIVAQRLEPILNLGADLNAQDVGRSILFWTVGAVGDIYGGLSGYVVFLGRHELAPQTDPIKVPFFFQIERNDIFDAGVGFRYRFADNGTIAADALIPMNRDGFRADVIPTVSIEYAFSLPANIVGHRRDGEGFSP